MSCPSGGERSSERFLLRYRVVPTQMRLKSQATRLLVVHVCQAVPRLQSWILVTACNPQPFPHNPELTFFCISLVELVVDVHHIRTRLLESHVSLGRQPCRMSGLGKASSAQVQLAWGRCRKFPLEYEALREVASERGLANRCLACSSPLDGLRPAEVEDSWGALLPFYN